ncbi:hypothetical protein [Bradyrhizobium erythrophlei]|jgi:hypothetical protein|uniref:Uncharacterized protein n=1 Tax=Bradyrhizobium erythrophlei TaxID=1437360 RepID=A0A1M5PVF9_9BRAD|nr:hypothetical protein [Bradyrhizobium erythrophlei]SHH05273.1 hypothetical protein SAMN05444169_5471 [Bradyrhizobium erythrophlei]
MLNLKADLDTFIEETTAFANSIRVEPMIPRTVMEPNRKPSADWVQSEREEIARRIANLRAHQQRLKREREDYAASEIKRMLASR